MDRDREALLTIPEAAARARLAPRTIRRAIAMRQLHVVRPGGLRRVLIPLSELEVFIYGLERRGEPGITELALPNAPTGVVYTKPEEALGVRR